MKKLTKKLGMSTLALASVFAVGITAANIGSTASTYTIEQYGTDGQLVDNNDQLDVANGVSVFTWGNTTSAQAGGYEEVKYSYNITTDGTPSDADPSNVSFSVSTTLMSADHENAKGDALNTDLNTAISTATAATDIYWAISISGGNYTQETIISGGNDFANVTMVGDVPTITIDTANMSDASMTSVRAELDTIEANEQYTIKVYIDSEAHTGSNATESGKQAWVSSWYNNGTKLFQFNFTTPSTANGVITNTVGSNNEVTSNVSINTANSNTFMYADVRSTTDSTPQDADSSDIEISYINHLPTGIATEEDSQFYIATEITNLDTSSSVLTSVSTAQNAVYDSTVEQFAFRFDSTAYTNINTEFDTAEADTNYQIDVLVNADAAITTANQATTTETWFTVTLKTPATSFGNYDTSVANDDVIEPIWDQILNDPVAATVAVGLIVTSSLLLVAVIGMGAYIVVNNNKAKKAKAHSHSTHSHDKK